MEQQSDEPDPQDQHGHGDHAGRYDVDRDRVDKAVQDRFQLVENGLAPALYLFDEFRPDARVVGTVCRPFDLFRILIGGVDRRLNLRLVLFSAL